MYGGSTCSSKFEAKAEKERSCMGRIDPLGLQTISDHESAVWSEASCHNLVITSSTAASAISNAVDPM